MSVPVHCPACGLRFSSRMFSFTDPSNVTLSGNRESCPQCGEMADIQDGTYDFVGNAISSFRALDGLAIRRFQDVLKAAESDHAGKAKVISEAAALDPTFGKFVATLQALGGLPLLLAFIALWIQWMAYTEDTRDQEAVLGELRASNTHQEQLIEGMRELIEAQQKPASQPLLQPKPRTTHIQPSDVSGQDRAAKRRAWKLERKTSKDRSIKFQG